MHMKNNIFVRGRSKKCYAAGQQVSKNLKAGRPISKSVNLFSGLEKFRDPIDITTYEDL